MKKLLPRQKSADDPNTRRMKHPIPPKILAFRTPQALLMVSLLKQRELFRVNYSTLSRWLLFWIKEGKIKPLSRVTFLITAPEAECIIFENINSIPTKENFDVYSNM
jgi:hypothetical protein